MERNRSVATLQIVGRHPSLDLANTVASRRDRTGPDLLASYGDLLAWSLRTRLLNADSVTRLTRIAGAAPAQAECALLRVKRLREAIYGVFSAIAHGDHPPSRDVQLIGQEAGLAQAGRRLGRTSDGFGWAWLDGDLDATAKRVSWAAAELLTAVQVGRVKECLGRNCGWLFLDTSRNGLRRWCSDKDCGTPARVARHRSKARGVAAHDG